MLLRYPVVAVSSLTLLLILSGCGSNPPNPAPSTFTGHDLPKIKAQPSDQSVIAGQTATFSVQATGSGPLNFQWLKNSAAISGATSATYATPETTLGDNGATFSVVVSNSAGSVTSNAATLTVNGPPLITTQPSDQSVTAGQTATFSVQATGSGPLSYQWQKNSSAISGATSASYTTPAASLADSGSTFSVVVSNSAGSVTSNAATLTVNGPPLITTQPSDQSVTAGQTATFSVQATGSGPLNFQWLKNSAAISGATSASYATPATSLADSGSTFSVVVSNSAGSVTSTSATLTVNGPPQITTQPSDQSVTAGQMATFSVQATGSGPLSYQWQKNSSAISGATSATYTTPATTLADSGATFSVVVRNSAGSVTSNSATLTVTAPALALTDVLTYHNDNARTGQNLTETVLTTSNVSSVTFGKLGLYTMDGRVDAQPLVASGVAVPGQGTHNLLIAASEHDTVYAFDADTGTPVWSTSMLLSGEAPSDDRGCNQVTPEIGVTATPVIDRTRGPNGVIYVVAMSKNGSTYYQRLHALDLALGTEMFGGPINIQATYPGTGDNSDGTNVIFDPSQYKERVGLLLLNGTIYTGWASHCDVGLYTGWIIGYDAATLAQTSVLNVTPNGGQGGIWMAAAGFAGDNSGNIYFLDGNGSFDTQFDSNGFPINGDYGNAFLKLSTSNGKLAVADYFEMYNQDSENAGDFDLGSGGAMLLPDLNDASGNTVHLAVGAGKDTNLYIVNRDSMGKFNSSSNLVYQQLTGVFPGGVFAIPAYFNNTVYYGAVNNPMQAFSIDNAQLSTVPIAQTGTTFAYPGATPSISANGSSNGIVWAVENNNPAVLHAYDAASLTELYNSNQDANGRDQFGDDNKFIAPVIANGKVFVGTPTGVAVFGLLQ